MHRMRSPLGEISTIVQALHSQTFQKFSVGLLRASPHEMSSRSREPKSVEGSKGRIEPGNRVNGASATSRSVDSRDSKKKTKKSNNMSFKIYIFRILKQIVPDFGVSAKAMVLMNAFVDDMFDRLATEAARLAVMNKKSTISSREIQTSVKLIIPGQLGTNAIAEGARALARYSHSKSS